jgi:aspartate/tyrosine/aromatic aminotransferase
MFALLPLSADEVRVLRERDGIYIDAAGRIKIADLNDANFDRFASALTAIDVIQFSAQEIYCGKSQIRVSGY